VARLEEARALVLQPLPPHGQKHGDDHRPEEHADSGRRRRGRRLRRNSTSKKGMCVALLITERPYQVVRHQLTTSVPHQQQADAFERLARETAARCPAIPHERCAEGHQGDDRGKSAEQQPAPVRRRTSSPRLQQALRERGQDEAVQDRLVVVPMAAI